MPRTGNERVIDNGINNVLLPSLFRPRKTIAEGYIYLQSSIFALYYTLKALTAKRSRANVVNEFTSLTK